MLFKETSKFTKIITDLIDDDSYAELQKHLTINPEIGDLIIGSHGLRKIRWKCKGKGKKGGARIIYYLVTQEDWILFLTAFSKNEKDDLTKEQIKILCKMVEGD